MYIVYCAVQSRTTYVDRALCFAFVLSFFISFFNHFTTLAQTTQRQPSKSISEVWSQVELEKFTQTFLPSRPLFFSGVNKREIWPLSICRLWWNLTSWYIVNPWTAELWNSTSGVPVKSQIADGTQSFQSLNRYNSAADCVISLKCGTKFDYLTSDTLKTCTFKGSNFTVTTWCDVLAVKTIWR